MIHSLDGPLPLSLEVSYAPADVPTVLRVARAVLAATEDTANPLDILAADRRIDTMAELVGFRLNLGVAEVALSTLLTEANLQCGGKTEEQNGQRIFTDTPSRLAEQALRGAVWQQMYGES